MLAPQGEVHEVLKRNFAGKTPTVHVTIINTREDVVIAGESEACETVVAQLGRERAISLGHDMAVHCPEVGDFETPWRKLHTRKTYPRDDIRFYSNYLGGVYEPDEKNIARALTGQALQTVDYPMIVERAYADGVRIFLEHGPRGLLSDWVSQTLDGREHLAIALDAPKGGLARVYQSLALLFVAGVDLPFEVLGMQAPRDRKSVAPDKFIKSFAAHPDPVNPGRGTGNNTMKKQNIAELPQAQTQQMAPPPSVASVFAEPANPYGTGNGGVANGARPSGPQAPIVTPVQTTPIPQPVSTASSSRINESDGLTTRGGAAAEILMEELRRKQAEISQTHRQFMEEQARLHSRYMEITQKAMGDFLRGVAAFSGNPEVVDAAGEVNVSPALSPDPAPLAYAAPVAPVHSVPTTPASSGEIQAEPIAPVNVPPASAENHTMGFRPAPEGPAFSRQDLQTHASGEISKIFGPLFEKQDGFRRQVRMPEPPLLLADRVTGIKGEPGTMGLGTVWTETDVTKDAWYLHRGRMPAGIMIESGQADLFLISWLGVDFLNQGERIYRLLGCELTYQGGLPRIGDTLEYDIHSGRPRRSGRCTSVLLSL